MKVIIGLDLSLTGAAACSIPVIPNWSTSHIFTRVFGHKLAKEASDLERLQRFHAIASGVEKFIDDLPIFYGDNKRGLFEPVVFVEQYAFTQSGAMASENRECGGIVKYRLWRKLGIVVTPIVAASARKTLLNKCPRSGAKEFVVKNVRRLEGNPRRWTEDETDAFVIANHGMRLIGAVAMNFDGE